MERADPPEREAVIRNSVMRTTSKSVSLSQLARSAAKRHCALTGSAALLLCLLSGAAHAQTHGPAMSFNVLNFGDPTANKRSAISSNGDIPPLDYSLVSALTTNVTQSMLGSGDMDANASAPMLEPGRRVFGYGLAGSAADSLRRSIVARGRLADLRAGGQGMGNKAGAGNGSAAFAANGSVRVGFDALELTGRNARRNTYLVNASDFGRASRLALHTPAGSVAIVNVVGAQGTPDAFPVVTGMPPKDVYFNFVSADNMAAGEASSVGNGADGNGSGGASSNGGKNEAGYLNTSLSAASLSAGNAGDPIGAFGNVSGGSGDYARNGMGGSGQIGFGGINAATPPTVGVSSVLPENSGLLLLCSGLLGLLPLAWRKRS